MIFSLLIIHEHDRMSSIAWVIRTATWDFFTARLPHRLKYSPRAVKEAIMTDIDGLVQELMTSRDGAVGAFFEMRRLLEILQGCFNFLQVCFELISVFSLS